MIITLTMEVPCCSKLPKLIEKALDITRKEIPLEEIVTSTQGTILTKSDLVR